MTTCDDYQVAVEQRLHGALDAASAGTLAGHLASCEVCRAFETRATELEAAMQMHAAQMSGEVDWERLGRGLGRWRRRLLAGSWQGLVLGLVMVPLLALAFGRDAIVSGLIGCVTVLVWGWVIRRRRIAEAERARRSTEQLLEFLRAQLDEHIRIEKQNAIALPIIALLPLVGLSTGVITPWSVFGAAAAMALLTALALRSRFSVLPRLERERAELR